MQRKSRPGQVRGSIHLVFERISHAHVAKRRWRGAVGGGGGGGGDDGGGGGGRRLRHSSFATLIPSARLAS